MQPSIRDFKLAKIFLNHSVKLKPKEKVLITTSDSGAFPLVKATYIEALKMGAFPVIDTQVDYQIGRNNMSGLLYQFFKHANDWQLTYAPEEILNAKIEWADAFVRIVALDNTQELSQISQEKILTHRKVSMPFLEKIVDKDRWILTYYPTNAMAQDAGVSLDWLLDFYYKSCIVDYSKMDRDLKKIERKLDDGAQVHIIGTRTDLTFSIKNRLAQAAAGERNIPDGEVFIAPVHETINGTVYFDFPTEYTGGEMNGIHLTFEKGKITKAKAEIGNANLQKILNTDPGARSLGELGIGANYNIKRGMKNTLFDEKIGGTIHLALGRSYKEERGGAPTGGNISAIHWDIVKDMRKKGSVLMIDDKPLLKEGKFLV